MSPAWATVPSGCLWGYLVDGLRLGVVRVEEANELGGAHFGRVRVHKRRPLGRRGREPLRRRRVLVWLGRMQGVHGVEPRDAGPGVRVRVRGRMRVDRR